MPSSRTPTNAIDHVGSLKRPPELVAAWRAWEAGQVSAEELREVQDRMICDAIGMQEDLDLPLMTDGEFRRAGWSRGFLNAVDGFRFAPSKLTFRDDNGFATPSPAPIAFAKVRRAKPIVLDDFVFANSVARRPVKVTMPTPSHMHFGHFKAAVGSAIYPDVEAYWDDLVTVFRHELTDLYDAGCRHVQLDEVPLALLCDPNIRSLAKSEGDDPGKLVEKYIDVLNRAVAKRPADLTISMHLCRGNMEGLWMGDGGYAPIAEALFTRADVDAFLLEYNSPRAGDFAPLRYLPIDKRAYLGIISTKTPTPEQPDDLMRRIEEASQYAPIERLGICPQCGFSSAAMSKYAVLPSKVTVDIQTTKLKLLVDIGRRAWGQS